MHYVSRAALVRDWLARERRKQSLDPGVPCPPDEAFDHLLDYEPGAAAFLWRGAPVRGYRTTITRERFRRLHVIEGPPNLRWRALSPDGTVLGAARALETLADGRGRLAEMGVAARGRYEVHPTWAESMEDARAFLRGVARRE